eukprot:UN09733
MGGMPGMPGMGGMGGMGGGGEQRSKPYKDYFKYIQCQVCDESVKQLIRRTKLLNSKSTPSKPLSEEILFNLTESICNPYKDDGIWITQYDIIKKSPKLMLKQMVENNNPEIIGECIRECETIAIACIKIMDENNIEISEYLFSNLGKLKRSKLKSLICKKPYC